MIAKPNTPSRISVIGCGYLGTVHAAAMASLGHTVVGIDTDRQRIQSLTNGETPFFEPGLAELLAETRTSGRLTFSTEIADAAAADIHFICVGTPQSAESGAADLSSLFAAVDQLLPALSPGDLVVGKSTVPVGTAQQLRERLAASGAALVWNPEFLREGHAVADTLAPDRIVIGAGDTENDKTGVRRLAQVYQAPLGNGTPLVETDLATAELVKGAANAYLATRISFVNALAEVADASGADVTKLTEALGYDDRIGHKYLGAGLGFGGGCLPKDIRAFAVRARELGAESSATLLDHVDAINLGQRERAVMLVTHALEGSVAGRRVTILGASFKPNSDDIRDSPALDVAHELTRLGADVTVTDPAALGEVRRAHPMLQLEPSLIEALLGAEAVVLATDWREYRELEPTRARQLVSCPIMVDGRNCLDRVSWVEAGWMYYGIGQR